MTGAIALVLTQDGVSSGAIYALIALALLIVFTTRVILVPQGQFVTYGALTYALMQVGERPGTAWLLMVAATTVAVIEARRAIAGRCPRDLVPISIKFLALPAALLAATQGREQLPDSNPTKAVTAQFMPRYEERFGKENRSNFAPQAYDAWIIIQNAIPAAMAKAKPGTEEFRVALRDAIEGTRELHANAGVFNFSPTDHAGLDERAAVVVRVDNGKWALEK
jgi:hypothetical protein